MGGRKLIASVLSVTMLCTLLLCQTAGAAAANNGEKEYPVANEVIESVKVISKERPGIIVYCIENTEPVSEYEVQNYDVELATRKDFSDSRGVIRNVTKHPYYGLKADTTYYIRARYARVNKGKWTYGSWGDTIECKTVKESELLSAHKKKDVNADGTYDAKLFTYGEKSAELRHTRSDARYSNPADEATALNCDKAIHNMSLEVYQKYSKYEAERGSSKLSKNAELYIGILNDDDEILDSIFYEYY